jgi:hypothetical protein
MWPTQADLHALAHFDLALHKIPSAFDAHSWSDAHQAVPELGSFASSWLLAAPGSPVARQARERPATASVSSQPPPVATCRSTQSTSDRS